MSPTTLERLGLAAMGVSWLYDPPDWWGQQRLGISALSGSPQQVPWDAWATASAPGLPGELVHFAVDENGAIVSQEGIADQLLDPPADALTNEVGPSFVALSVKHEDDVWAAIANEAELVEIPEAPGDELEVTRRDGEEDGRVDGAEVRLHLHELDELLDWEGGTAVRWPTVSKGGPLRGRALSALTS